MTANLLSRLQGLTAPDREVDALIWASTLPTRGEGIDGYGLPPDGACFEYEADDRGGVSMYVIFTDGKGSRRAKRPAPELTASLDATVALCERVLPGYDWTVDKSGGRGFAGVGQSFNEEAATPAIALLIAILTATEARDAAG